LSGASEPVRWSLTIREEKECRNFAGLAQLAISVTTSLHAAPFGVELPSDRFLAAVRGGSHCPTAAIFIGCVTPMAVVLSLPSPSYDHAFGEVSNSPFLFTRNIRASMPGIPQMAQERRAMENRVAVSKCR